MATRIRGTALVPGVSKNMRYYSPAVIRGAVERAQPKVQAGRMIMRSHHDSGDDTTRVIGRILALTAAEDGSARFEAELADTAAGRDIAALVKGTRPFVNAVSISGYWTGKIRRLDVAGESVEAGEGLDLETIDLTTRPGVDGARFTAESVTRDGRTLIYEEAPGPVTPTEPDARELAAMTNEEFRAQAWPGLAGYLSFGDRREPSPFMRGLRQTT